MEIVYAGRIDNRDGKALSHLYYKVDSEERLIFGKKVGGPSTSIGSITSCEDRGEGTFGNFINTGKMHTEAFIKENSIRDKAVYELHRTNSLNSKISKELYDKLVMDLRNVTFRLSKAEKKAFITKIVLEIL